MNKLLTGYTDVTVRTTLLQDAKATGIYAYVDINFPGEGNTIANIPWKKTDFAGKMGFPSPRCVVINNGSKEGRPVFTGQWHEEISTLCAKAIDMIKQQIGTIKTGRTYRVNGKGATDITGEENGKAVDSRTVVG